MKKEGLQKYLNNQCSPKELERVSSWLRSDDSEDDARGWLEEEWVDATESDFEHHNYDLLLHKIHHKINLEQTPQLPVRKSLPISTWLVRVAAILLLPIASVLFYMLAENNFSLKPTAHNPVNLLEVTAPVGSKAHFMLADGSEVYLNHGSSLQYPTEFSENTREVTLNGEGYFKIAHNPDKPFIVKTAHMNVTALGTEFNVFAYNDETVTETTLVNGRVAIEKINEKGKKQTLGEMKPGQHLSYLHDKDKIKVEQGEVEKYISWKEGRLIFKNDPIDQIAKRLSRWYNVEIVFENEWVKTYTYTATFNDETLSQIMNLLSIATPISYKMEQRRKLPNGTYSKQKVIINKK